MRHTAGRLNRTWLAIIGLVLAVTGLLTAAIGLRLLDGVAVAGLRAPDPDQPILALTSDGPTLAAVLIGVGALIGALAVGWLLAQVPRKHGASTLKLQDHDNRGLTIVRPTLLEDAISARVEELDDVIEVKAVIRGSSRTPDLTLRVTVSPRADVPELVRDVDHLVTSDLRVALGQEPAAVAIAVDVRSAPRRSKSVSLAATPA